MNYDEANDGWSFDESDGKEVVVKVIVPGIPADWPPERVASWVYSSLGHPIDSAYEAFVRTEAVSETPHGSANPERVDNGCMIYKTGEGWDYTGLPDPKSSGSNQEPAKEGE